MTPHISLDSHAVLAAVQFVMVYWLNFHLANQFDLAPLPYLYQVIV